MTGAFRKYFPDLTTEQADKLDKLKQVYERWNLSINVISRKDMDNFDIHHVLHSLAVAKAFSFTPGSRVLDVGTGGGFPGVPLSVLFPDVSFTLLDSIEKKIKVVSSVASEMELKNVNAVRRRVEEEKEKYDYVISRAVTAFDDFVKLTRKNLVSGEGKGIICLKGGDLEDELRKYRARIRIWNISDFFEEPFFETKKIVYLPA